VHRSTITGSRASVLLLAKLCLFCCVAFTACELFWRASGARPEPSDLLGFARLRTAVRNSPDAVALLGSSRVLCDIDPRILARYLPGRRFFQLAINGQSGLPLLEDLAHDDRFRGLVLCEFHPRHFLAEYPFVDDIPALRFAQRWRYGEFVDAWLTEHVKEHSVVLGGDLWDLISRKLNPQLPGPRLEQSRDDRFLGLSLTGKDNSQLIARWMQMEEEASAKSRAKHFTQKAFERVPRWVEAIRRRGGDVVFIRMPVSGSLKYQEERLFPSVGSMMSALVAGKITLIDSAAEAGLNGFECPDESHLDATDATRFSSVLARLLRDRELLHPTLSDE
jgi:hypothetical protein